MATTSGNDPLSPSRQLGCDTCRISGQVGCRPAARTQRVRINNPVPTPGGTVGKISWSGVRESNPPHLLGRQRPKATRPTPLKSRALCFALRLPVSMRRIVACAGLWAGVFGWSESGSELSLPVCPRPCAGGKAKSELDRGDSGHKLPEQRTTQRRAMGARGCAGIEKFSDGYEHGSRFLRASDSEVKRRVNTQRGT